MNLLIKYGLHVRVDKKFKEHQRDDEVLVLEPNEEWKLSQSSLGLGHGLCHGLKSAT